MNKKLLPWFITFCALGLAITAGYYSVIGLSKLFAGTAIAVIIMASFLELSKLVIATLLHSYWSELNKLYKFYLIISLVILSILTSAGIYGMLSSGYQEISNKSETIDRQIVSLETKKKTFENTKDNLLKEKESLNTNISNLQNSLSVGIVLQSRDKDGNLITRESKGNRITLEKQLDKNSKQDDKISSKLDIINDSIFNLENQILEIKNTNTISELGPLKYISKLINKPMDKIINWFILIIILVFDPLAICLVIAANFSFNKLKTKTVEPSSINISYQELQDDMSLLKEELPIESNPQPPNNPIQETWVNNTPPPYVSDGIYKGTSTIKPKQTDNTIIYS
jgi:hypothetical protein